MNKQAIYIPVAIVLIYCLLAIALYGTIVLFFPAKYVDKTVLAGELNSVTSPDKKYIINVSYYSNHDNSGIEMFEIKMNQFMDAKSALTGDPSVYSKGLQIVGAEEGSIKFDYGAKLEKSSFNVFFGAQQISTFKYSTTSKEYYYDSQQGVSFNSTNAISDDSVFKISLGSGDNAGLYIMKFLGADKLLGETNSYLWIRNLNVIDYNLNYFANALLNVCRNNSTGYGADGLLTVDMGQLFQFQALINGAYSGEWIKSYVAMESKLQIKLSDYFTIRIQTFESGATTAKDSLFGIVENKQNFEVPGATIKNDYFYGAQIIELNEYNFNYKKYYNVSLFNAYNLSLNNKTKQILDENKTLKIEIVIDKNNLLSNFITYNSINKDSLERYKERINSIKLSSKDSNGNISYEEVKLWE